MAGHDGEFRVTLLLQGGHTRTLYLGGEDPLLASLVSSVVEKGGGANPARPFHIHLDQGRQSLIFSSADLVGVTTDPALPQVADSAATIEKSRYLTVENFIDASAHADLLKFVLAREREFVPSSVSTNDAEYRRSLVLHHFPPFAELFRDRVRALLPRLTEALDMGAFPVSDIECQLTAHNDGNYFKLHNDNGSPDTIERTISYVYYFNHEPKGFSGGEFRLYDTRVVGGRYECGEAAADIAPKNNSILFFPSHCHHEVLPVRCPSKRFIDSRFTVNGWVRQAKAA